MNGDALQLTEIRDIVTNNLPQELPIELSKGMNSIKKLSKHKGFSEI